jgi:hypothetical protein
VKVKVNKFKGECPVRCSWSSKSGGGATVVEDQLLASVSHGLGVELAEVHLLLDHLQAFAIIQSACDFTRALLLLRLAGGDGLIFLSIGDVHRW